MGFGKEDHRAGMPSSSPDKGTTHQHNLLLVMLNRIPWLRCCLSDFSLLQSYPSLPPPFHTLLSGRKSLSSGHTYVMELWSYAALPCGPTAQVLWNSLSEEIELFLHICLFTHLFTSAWTREYLFILWGKNPTLPIDFVAQNCPDFGHGELFFIGSYVPWICLQPFVSWSIFLLSGRSAFSRFIFHIFLESVLHH